MIGLLAMLPTIFNGIGKVKKLMTKGKEVYEQVTGKKSNATNAEELQNEVNGMSGKDLEKWATVMASKTKQYEAENGRIEIEGGRITETLQEKVGPEAAEKITILRMTTRPWTVRMMVHYVLFPFYLVVLDAAQLLAVSWLSFLETKLGVVPFKTFEYVFGALNVSENTDPSLINTVLTAFKDGGPTTFAGQLYMESIPWVISIIIGYMGLREVGKSRKDNGSLLNKGTGFIGKLFNKG